MSQARADHLAGFSEHEHAALEALKKLLLQQAFNEVLSFRRTDATPAPQKKNHENREKRYQSKGKRAGRNRPTGTEFWRRQRLRGDCRRVLLACQGH
jgi:hypothetical protein